jgi:hypothetical protein
MIQKLTVEQINLFPHYVEKWTKHGYDTSPLDPVAVKSAIEKLYTCGGLKPPEKIVLCRGPIEAILTVNMYFFKKENPKATKKEIIAFAKKNSVFTSCGYGSFDASWVSFYDFFQNETDIGNLDIINGIKETTLACGWYWAYSDICFVSEKPYILKVNDVNMLHCEDGPALAYHDGTELYFYNGVMMDKETICNHASITPESINNTDNEEQKRIKIEIYGVNKYLEDIKADVIDMDMVKINSYDKDSDAIPRALIKDKDGNHYLVGTDGSTERTYYMNVPNTVKTCAAAHNAIAPLKESNCIASS